jgi:Lysylphosphatidylglycerol synthase TM region
MNRGLRIGALLFGALMLAVLIVRSGPATLLATLATSGWIVVALVPLWGVVYLCNARAWQLLVPHRSAEFTLARAYLLTISGFAINYATPLLAMGGEPLKISGAVPLLGRHRAVGSVVGYRFLYSLAHLISVLAALVPAAILLPHTVPIDALLGAIALVVGLLAWFLLSRHRDGIFEGGVALLGGVPLLRRVAARLERQRPMLQELDHELTAIHRQGRWHFAGALAVELTGRLLSTLEYGLIMYSFGLGFDVVRGFVVAGLSSIVSNAMFFVPYEMGAKEGGVFLVFSGLGLDPALGTSAALLTRVREVVWMALGLLVLALIGGPPDQADQPV